MPLPVDPSTIEQIPAYVLALLTGGGAGGGVALKWIWDHYRRDRLDTWEQAQGVIDDLRTSLKETQDVAATRQAQIVILGEKLDAERKVRWSAEDAAAVAKRKNALLEEQNEELREQNDKLDEVLEINRQLRETNAELVRHVYECEVRTRKHERNLRYLRDRLEGKAERGDQWEDLPPIVEADLAHFLELVEDSDAAVDRVDGEPEPINEE